MPLYEPTLPYRYVVPLVTLLDEQDPDGTREILAAAGMDGAAPLPPDSSLPMARFEQLLTLASERLQRSDLGFEMGRRITLDSHSTLGQALKRCSTLQELLLLIERYYHLVTPAFAARYLPGEQVCEWRIRVAAPMTQATLHMMLEMQAVSMHADLLRLFGTDANLEIYLSAPPPPHASRYRRLYHARFHFSSGTLPEVRCVLPAALVNRRLPPRRGVGESRETDIRTVSQTGLQPAKRYGEWVALMLREAQAAQPTVAELAELLNLSPRTLARKLSMEGINFRELATRIRYERACTLLDDPHTPMHQIACQLGYSDTTAFIRAFRASGGISPGLYRDSSNKNQQPTFGNKCQSAPLRLP